MNFNEYQERAKKTAVYPEKHRIVYPALGLNGEAGEVAEKVKKVIRDNDGEISATERLGIIKEIGDVLWYAAALAGDLGIKLDDIAVTNIKKLEGRAESGTIHGSGDDR